eukprot:m.18588 g.18588  ORF g.18588 m.18588 type:complete len:1068 (+) comp4984_c0_seq1:136-3339(+)
MKKMTMKKELLEVEDGKAWGEKMQGLLKEEQDEESKTQEDLYATTTFKELEKKGLCLRKLKLRYLKNSLQGKIIATLETARGPDKNPLPLPSSKIKVGSLVEVLHKGSLKRVSTGVVTKFQTTQIGIEIEQSDDDEDEFPEAGLVVRLLVDTITFSKNSWTLDHLYDEDFPGHGLVKLLLLKERTLQTRKQREEIYPINPHLNESQMEAVHFALERPDIAILHGPPGTGKTTTIVEIVAQLVKKGKKILLAAASNMAVDNVMERLLKCKISAVRIGHPSRTLDSVKQNTLMSIVHNSQEMGIVDDIHKEIGEATSKKGGRKRVDWRNVKELRKEARQREGKIIKDVLKGAQVVCGTTTTINRKGIIHALDLGHFDVAVVDEAGQALEVAAWAAILQAPSCILAGDHLQLPPTVKSKAAEDSGLGISLLERAVHTFGDEITVMLDTQYRMHKSIQGWSSEHLYNNNLHPDESVANHLLSDLDYVDETEETGCPVIFVDTAGSGCYETVGDDGLSKSNEGEASIVMEHIQLLRDAGVKEDDIGVITPYNLQVEAIRTKLAAENIQIEVSSVDGFQGREKEAIIISLVRSNTKRAVGFLSDYRRINVAITRAKRHLCIVGDSNTVTSDSHMASLVAFLHDSALLSSVYNYEIGGELLGRLADKTSPRQSNSNSGSKKPFTKEERTQHEEQRKREAEERKKRIHERLLCQIESMMKKRDVEHHKFPNTLSSFERMLIHQICEEKGLGHKSEGEGKDRHLLVLFTKDATKLRSTEEVESEGSKSTCSSVEESVIVEESVEVEEKDREGTEKYSKDKEEKELTREVVHDDHMTQTSANSRELEEMQVNHDSGGQKVKEELEGRWKHSAEHLNQEESDVQRMLRLRKERIEQQRRKIQSQVEDTFKDRSINLSSKKKDEKHNNSSLKKEGKVRSSNQRGHVLGGKIDTEAKKKRKKKGEEDLDALVAAIENPDLIDDDDFHKNSMRDTRVQRNPFIDATHYARSNFVDKGSRGYQTIREKQKEQLKIKLQNTISDQSTERKAKPSSNSKDKKGNKASSLRGRGRGGGGRGRGQK